MFLYFYCLSHHSCYYYSLIVINFNVSLNGGKNATYVLCIMIFQTFFIVVLVTNIMINYYFISNSYYDYTFLGKNNDELLDGANRIQDLTFDSLGRTRGMIEASKEVGAATIEGIKINCLYI